MTSIGTRILVVVMAMVVGLTLLSVVLTGVRRYAESESRAAGALADSRQLWDRAVEEEATRVREAIVDDSGAVNDLDPAANQRAFANVIARDVKSIAFYDEIGQSGLLIPAGAKSPGMHTAQAAQLAAGGGTFQEVHVHAADGQTPAMAEMIVGGSVLHPSPARSGFVATVSIDRVVTLVNEAAADGVFLLDTSGTVVARAGTIAWDTVSDAFATRSGPVTELWSGGTSVQIVALPLEEDGRQIGTACLVYDVTNDRQLLDSVDTISIALMLVVCLVGVVSLRWLLIRQTGQLNMAINALVALADGDTGVEILGSGRADEIGRMAGALHVLRESMRSFRHTGDSRIRQWQREQEFVRAQMMHLADTLSEEARAAFFADFARIESGRAEASTGGGSLAFALEVMADRVRDQHGRLDGLIAQLQAALSQKTELFQLQQQVAIARRMQENMLPRGLPPGSPFEAAATLVPAEAFGGGFFDYVVLPDDCLAVIMAQPAGSGLAAGFVAAVVRTSLTVLLNAGLSPSESLARTARLLVGDAAAQGLMAAIAVFDAERRTATWASAGIAPPVMIRRLGDVVEPMHEQDVAVSGDPDQTFQEVSIAVPHRATVVMAPPSLFEGGGGLVSRGRFLEILREAPDLAPEQVLTVLRDEGVISARMAAQQDRFCVIIRAKM